MIRGRSQYARAVLDSSYNLISGKVETHHRQHNAKPTNEGKKKMVPRTMQQSNVFEKPRPRLRVLQPAPVPEEKPSQRKLNVHRAHARGKEEDFNPSVKLHPERNPTASNNPIPTGGNLVQRPRKQSHLSADSPFRSQDHKYVAEPKKFRPQSNPNIQRPVTAHHVWKPSFRPNEHHSHSNAVINAVFSAEVYTYSIKHKTRMYTFFVLVMFLFFY